MKDKADKLFDEAIDKLNEANEELYRPEEDVVTYTVCKNSQQAIANFLKGFLFKNGVDASQYKSINGLYEQCKLIDKKFEKLDLADFECSSFKTGSRYCNEVEKVSTCFAAADNLDTFLRKVKIIS